MISIARTLGAPVTVPAIAFKHLLQKGLAKAGDLYQFFEGVMKTRKGSYTEIPVKSNFGWHIIKVEDARPFKVPTLEQFMADRQAIERLVMKMRYEKAEGMLKDLRAKAKIETK